MTAYGSLAQGVLILTEQYFHSRKPADQSDFSSWKRTCGSLLEKFKIASKRETINLGLSCWFSEDYWRDENYVPHDIQNSIQFDYKE